MFLLQEVFGEEALVYLLSIIHPAAYTLRGSSETKWERFSGDMTTKMPRAGIENLFGCVGLERAGHAGWAETAFACMTPTA